MKKKKFLAASLMAGVLAMGSLVPANAADTNDKVFNEQGGTDTQVKIRVYDDINDMAPSLNVTIPTVLAIAVIADKNDTTGTPIALVSSDGSANGLNKGSLTFINQSKKTTYVTDPTTGQPLLDDQGNPVSIREDVAEVYINGVTTTVATAGWALGQPTDKGGNLEARQLSITLTGDGVSGTDASYSLASLTNAPGKDADTDFSNDPLVLKASQFVGENISATPTTLLVEVEVGGQNKDYVKEQEADAFTLAWSIKGEYDSTKVNP